MRAQSCNDPVGLGGIHLAQRVGTRPIVVVAVDVQFLGQVGEIPESRISGNAAPRDPAAAEPPRCGWSLASTASSASMPSAGAMGSRTLKVSERATPMSDHWPQLIAVAGKPDARRHATRPSSHALAQA